jgi:hypothetical protein
MPDRNPTDTKAKCRHLKKFKTGDTVSHVGIFDPALRTVALCFTAPPPPFPV